MKKSVLYIVSAAIFIFSFGKINAQNVPATFLDINPDPYMTGMANAGSAMYATPYAIWNNNASTVFSENKMDIGVSYGIWQPDYAGNNVISAAGYDNINKFMSVSAGIKYFAHKSYDIVDENGIHLGKESPNEMIAGVGLALRFAKVVSLSANLNYVLSNMGKTYKSNGVSANIGAMVNLDFMRIGLTVSNLGTNIKYDDAKSYTMPANLKLGTSTTQKFGEQGKHELSASLQAGMVLSYNTFFAELGAEYIYDDMVRIAAGYHYGDSKKYIPEYISLGLGFKYWRISLNASYLLGLPSDSPIGNTFSVGLGYSF